MSNPNYDYINVYVNDMDNTLNNLRGEDRITQIKQVIEQHSFEHGWLRLFLDYDYQVCNGGHAQYVGNGYHSTQQRGCMSDTSDNSDIHQYFVELTIQFFDKYNVALKDTFIKLLKDFEIEIDEERETEEECHECQGEGYDDDDQVCQECNGDGTVIVDNQNYGEVSESCFYLFDQMDGKYYTFNDDLFNQIVIALKNQKISDNFKHF